MSGSDTESSCGWTFVYNEGSDIETLAVQAVDDADSAMETSGLQTDTLSDIHHEVKEDSLEVTLNDTDPEEAGMSDISKGHVSSSDHSDILTLGELKDDDPVTADTSEELYLGRSCSSQYTFTSTQTVFPVHPLPHSSSSEDEPDLCSEAVVRRRRVRRNTLNTSNEPDHEEASESDERFQEQKTAEGQQLQNSQSQHHCSLITFVLLGLLIAVFSMSYSYNTQIQERQFVDEIKLKELSGLRDLINRAGKKDHVNLNELDVLKAISVLSESIDKMKKDNQGFNTRHAQIYDEKEELEVQLKKTTEENNHIKSQHQSVMLENIALRQSLQKEEQTLSILQEEVRTMGLLLKDLEALRARAGSLLSENQQLKVELEREKEVIHSFIGKRESLIVALENERIVTDELREEITKLRLQISGAKKAKNMNYQLTELQERLNFAQQRSDMWERLYLEIKEEQAKEDTGPKVRKSKSMQGMAGKVKETFDAVKNSTKDFVHHHKEQIKKANKAVKENLRKFSDSVKSTFRNFKDSASTILNKARGFYEKRYNHRSTDDSSQHKTGKRAKKPFKFNFDFFQNHFTRNSAEEGHKKFKPQSCSEVFDCAYQEFMSLFNKAADPIQADEFHQLLQSYLQKAVDHFPYWKELTSFVNGHFHNGLFIHDQMLFTDFINDVENFLTDIYKHQGLNEDFFEDLDDYIYRHFFGKTYSKNSRPRGQFEQPNSREAFRDKHSHKQQRSRHGTERKWSKSGQNRDKHMADVKIELGPMPFDPKY